MVGSPDNVARARYNQTMRSSIFDPPPEPQVRGNVPLGKRRDQTTSEMFGSYEEKDLRGAPLTFVPRDDGTTARQKKMAAMSSDVLPCSAMYAAPSQPQPYDELRANRELPKPVDFESDEVVDTNMRRQQELQSKLFGRTSPVVNPDQLHSCPRLTPTNVTWHAYKGVHQDQDHKELTHGERAFLEKCSNVFDRQSPQTFQGHLAAERQFKAEEREGDERRRSDVYYSDIFDRRDWRDHYEGHSQTGERRFKAHGHPEDQFVVHQDWTDAKTELMSGRTPRPEHPALRKSDELHQARIFGPRDRAWEATTERVPPMTDDNSSKLKGMAPSQVHQAHLRSSVTPDSFYEQAWSARQWQVAELYISGLPSDADDRYIRCLCQGFDLQIVKAAAYMDPVSNRCQGKAKVVVRYNPEQREALKELVRKFEATNLRVEA